MIRIASLSPWLATDLASLSQERVKSPIIKIKLKDPGRAHRSVSVLRPVAIELLASNSESGISE